MKGHFSRYGIPDVLVTDNGPQFASESFKNFADEWGFQVCPSSPGHQQANGAAESAVKTAKRLLRKAKTSGRDPYLALLAHRNTPTEAMGSSPAQRMLGRRTKTLLPTTAELLRPQTTNIESTKERKKIAQAKQAHYYNRHAKDLEALEEGDIVRMRPFQLGRKTWDKAMVKQRLDERSYEVETESGSTYRRNRVDLNRTAEQPDGEQSTTPSVLQTAGTDAGTTEQSEPQDLQPARGSCPTSSRPQRATKEPAYLKDYIRY